MKSSPSSRLFLAGIIGLFILSTDPSRVQAQFGKTGATSEQDSLPNLFLPADRTLRQSLARAQKAIDDQQFADAVEELGKILSGDVGDDFFLGTSAEGDAQTSLKTQAKAMLGSMPEKGRKLYELNYGAEARAKLDEALAEGNVTKLTDVSRRFFHTKAGYEAALLLGRLQLDQGRPLAAALTFKRVAEVDSAASLYDPELSLLLATGWLFAQQPDKARETLVALKQRNPDAKIALGKEQTPLFAKDDEALAWLSNLVGTGGKARHSDALQWVMFRGNATRTASTVASLPLLSARWTIPTLDDPADQQKVRQIARNRTDKTESLIPSLQPLIVNDFVIYRTPDRIIGASLKDQGKRIWPFPWDETSYEKAARMSGAQNRSPAALSREQELNVRIWEDHAFGQLSSDGEQVYVIDEIGFPPIGNQMVQRVFMGRGGIPFVGANFRSFNKLIALNLTREGALSWKVGGESGEDDPNLAGAFFLGPPLPLAGQLFVLAEFNGEIRLLCLNSKMGALEWKQSIAMMNESPPIIGDTNRRLAGATPSFADGILVCPTSGGGLVAVDLATRTLRWGYRYTRWDAAYISRPNGFGIQRAMVEGSPSHWIDGSVTIAGGCVLLTPVESGDLHCLDLLTGKAKWKPQPRGEMLYIACVHDGKVILVGKNQVKAIALATGEPAWSAAVELEAETPAGRGYYSDKFYYLPTTSSQLLKIDLSQGTVVARVKTGSPLGNLVCYKDELISQTSDGIASFYLSEPLRKRVDEILAKNPDDYWALARKGEILLQDGQQETALEVLRKAHKISPSQSDARGMLVRVMISLLRQDAGKYAGLADEAESLLGDQPELKREFYRLRAQALQGAGKTVEAFQAYLQLSEQPDPARGNLEDLEEFARDHSARLSRWTSARLAGLYAKADDESRLKMDAEIHARFDAAVAIAGEKGLRDFVELFGFSKAAPQGRVILAQRSVAANRLLDAELLVSELAAHADLEIAGPANAVLASVYEKAQRYDLAAERYVVLADRFSAVVCEGNATGKDLADAAAQRAEIQKQLALAPWAGGRAETRAADSQAMNGRFGFVETRYQVPIGEFRGAAPRGQKAIYSATETALRIFEPSGKLLASISLARSGSQAVINYNYPNLGTGKMNGHLMVVGFAGEVVALDTLRMRQGTSPEGILWRVDLADGDAALRRTILYSGVQTRSSNNPLLGPRPTVYSDPRGAVSIGPPTWRGVIYLRGRQLVCADPLSGKIFWERSGIEAGSDIFGDEEKIIVIAPGEKSDQALVYSALDGSLLDRRMVDSQDRRWTTSGRNILAWEASGEAVALRLYDASNQGAGLWTTKVNKGTRGCIIDGEELALLEPSGKFMIVSLASGKELLSATVDPETSLQSIAVQRSKGQYILMGYRTPTDLPNDISVSAIQSGIMPGTMIHGNVYAFDRATGKMAWQAPAFVSQHALPPDQPAESPLLIFVRNKRTARGAASSNTTSLLCLDKRDGSIVFDDDAFLAQAMYCDTIVDREKQLVTMSVGSQERNRVLTVKFTDEPTPPRPPAQTGLMSSLSVGQSRGVVVDVATDVFRALNKIQQGGANPPPGAGDDPFGGFRREAPRPK